MNKSGRIKKKQKYRGRLRINKKNEWKYTTLSPLSDEHGGVVFHNGFFREEIILGSFALEEFVLTKVMRNWNFKNLLRSTFFFNNIFKTPQKKKQLVRYLSDHTFNDLRSKLKKLAFMGTLAQVSDGTLFLDVAHAKKALRSMLKKSRFVLPKIKPFEEKEKIQTNVLFFDPTYYQSNNISECKTTTEFKKIMGYDITWLTQTVIASQHEREMKMDVIRNLQNDLVRDLDFVSKIESFGSFKQGFLLKNSDLDLSLLWNIKKVREKFGEKKCLRKSVLTYLYKYFLTRKDIQIGKYIIMSKVPLLKISCRDAEENEVQIDLVINNLMGVRNSEMIRTYHDLMCILKLDKFIYLLKLWNTAKGISNSAKKYISSFGWLIMAIGFLQHYGFLPSLQAKKLKGMKPSDQKDEDFINGFFFSYAKMSDLSKEDIEKCKGNIEKFFGDISNNEGELSIALFSLFLHYYDKFQYDKWVININYGFPFKREGEQKRDSISILDPFENRDLADHSYSNHSKIRNHIRESIKDLSCVSNVMKMYDEIDENNWMRNVFIRLTNIGKNVSETCNEIIEEFGKAIGKLKEEEKIVSVFIKFFNLIFKINMGFNGFYCSHFASLLYLLLKNVHVKEYVQKFTNILLDSFLDLTKKFPQNVFSIKPGEYEDVFNVFEFYFTLAAFQMLPPKSVEEVLNFLINEVCEINGNEKKMKLEFKRECNVLAIEILLMVRPMIISNVLKKLSKNLKKKMILLGESLINMMKNLKKRKRKYPGHLIETVFRNQNKLGCFNPEYPPLMNIDIESEECCYLYEKMFFKKSHGRPQYFYEAHKHAHEIKRSNNLMSMVGTLRVVESNDAFVKVKKYKKEIFIRGLLNKNRAFKTDDVCVQVIHHDKKKDFIEGKVVGIFKKNLSRVVVGTFQKKEFQQFLINNLIHKANVKRIREGKLEQQKLKKKYSKLKKEFEKFNHHKLKRNLKEDENEKKEFSKLQKKIKNIKMEIKKYNSLLNRSMKYRYCFMRPVDKKIPKFVVFFSDIENFFRKKITLKNIDIVSNFIYSVNVKEWKRDELSPTGEIVGILGLKRDFFSYKRSLVAQVYPSFVQYTKKSMFEVGFHDALNWEKSVEPMKEQFNWEEKNEIKCTQRVFTIDPIGSKDLDDAIAIEKITDTKSRLFIIVADIIKSFKRFPIDCIPKKLFASQYMKNSVEHLFDNKLSEGLFSLLPGVQRNAFVVSFDCDIVTSEITNVKVERNVIFSCCQLTYKLAGNIIKDPLSAKKEGFVHPKVYGGHKFIDIVDDIVMLNKFALMFKKNRLQKHSNISIDSGKTEYMYDKYGFPISTRNVCDEYEHQAHNLIEEYALLINCMISEHILNDPKYKKIFLRVHQKPKVKNLQKIIDVYNNKFERNFTLNSQNESQNEAPKDKRNNLGLSMRNFINEIETYTKDIPNGQSIFHTFRQIVAQSMVKAEYAVYRKGTYKNNKELGYHFGLDYHLYMHFSSPIRRFPDQLVHWQLSHDMFRGKSIQQKFKFYENLIKKVNVASQQDRAMENDLEKLFAKLYFVLGKNRRRILKGVVYRLGTRFLKVFFPALKSEIRFQLNNAHKLFYNVHKEIVFFQKRRNTQIIKIKKLDVFEFLVDYDFNESDFVIDLLSGGEIEYTRKQIDEHNKVMIENERREIERRENELNKCCKIDAERNKKLEEINDEQSDSESSESEGEEDTDDDDNDDDDDEIPQRRRGGFRKRRGRGRGGNSMREYRNENEFRRGRRSRGREYRSRSGWRGRSRSRSRSRGRGRGRRRGRGRGRGRGGWRGRSRGRSRGRGRGGKRY